MNQVCPVCGSNKGEQFFELKQQAVLIGVLWDNVEDAVACPKADITLVFCPDCTFVWNAQFDPKHLDYDQSYDNSLHFSPTFQNYSKTLVSRLIDSYDLRDKTVVDIGCGKGDFLIMLCEEGQNTGYGFDPSFEGDRPQTVATQRITWSNEYYSEEHAVLQADLLASRFVFEHIPSPRSFLEMMRRSISDRSRTTLFFEVPNIDLIVRQGSVWDIIYEHCSYFSTESLRRVFSETGFDCIRIEETYDNQYITIDARVSDGQGETIQPDNHNIEVLTQQVREFSKTEGRKRDDWQEKLASWNKEGRSVVAWGAGAKAVGLLNMLGDKTVIKTVVDINPNKHGKHLSGTGQRIIAPEDLRSDPPDIVVLMNPIYRPEIEEALSKLGLSPELIDV